MSESDEDVASRIEEYVARYTAAMHAVQTGVAMEMNFNLNPTSPKHLRVGVNSAMVDSGALATLLMEKGVFTEEEYRKALAEGAEREAETYAARLSAQLGSRVTLR